MGEYYREQRNQLSRAIANSGISSRQLKSFVDNRSQTIQMWHGTSVDSANLFQQATTRMTILGIPPAAITGLLGANGANIGDNTQAHHIIPQELYHPGVVTGTPLDDCGFNGMLLPSTKGLSYLMGRTAHVGSHPTYTANIAQNLRTLAPRSTSVRNILYNYCTKPFPSDAVKNAVNSTIAANRAMLSGNNPDTILS
ncbi:AHH domain-containing protein [uncultured Bacteroides sp.]|uniref:AHH domain-containing protein n=1 Tax=uncultured Bacteroides sp. TaxID=162156 RepID=UPI0025CFBFA5|nr:AHH domain-containing protein [uncultured Bacteroides sp.]